MSSKYARKSSSLIRTRSQNRRCQTPRRRFCFRDSDVFCSTPPDFKYRRVNSFFSRVGSAMRTTSASAAPPRERTVVLARSVFQSAMSAGVDVRGRPTVSSRWWSFARWSAQRTLRTTSVSAASPREMAPHCRRIRSVFRSAMPAVLDVCSRPAVSARCGCSLDGPHSGPYGFGLFANIFQLGDGPWCQGTGTPVGCVNTSSDPTMK